MNLCCKIQVCYLNINMNISIPFTDSCLHCGGIRSIFHVDKWLHLAKAAIKFLNRGAACSEPFTILHPLFQKNYAALLFPKHIQLCASILLLILFILPERHLAHLWLLTSHPSTLPSSDNSFFRRDSQTTSNGKQAPLLLSSCRVLVISSLCSFRPCLYLSNLLRIRSV